METEKVNELDRIIEKFTLDQKETLSKDAAWSNKSWHHETLASFLAKIINGLGSDAIELALEKNVDTFDVALYDVISDAVNYQKAIDMRDYSATFDEVA